MGSAGYDWVAVDLEHGAMSLHQLPELFRALELGNTLPLARIAQGQPEHCKQALDAGVPVEEIIAIEAAPRLNRIGVQEDYAEYVADLKDEITEQLRELY